ncbi:hypothetical protein [Vibrio sp. 1CM24A]|uniref:hypothetical protein n=1 Tax=Vibrio sp. 1CM24A TaxID=2929165 RepID=UPI0020BE29AB|nr:hypothetical protein [Vibrio sp. 1CM24A]MCK8080665.1 hypothetical protein [Vibrio sp. 1CM24A]
MNISLNSELQTDCAALPFIIGVSGHRDVKCLKNRPQQGLDGVKQAIKTCLLEWAAYLGPQTPVWLMSGMAAGSDLIVIEAAEELIHEGWNGGPLKIVPCLPMPQSNFELDFPSDDVSLQHFRAYQEKYKDNAIVVRSRLPKNRYQSALLDRNYLEDRNSLYLNQGAFLARYSNVLLCLWDGRNSLGSGGTGDIAKLKLGLDVEWYIEDTFVNPALRQPENFERHFSGIVQLLEVERQTPSQDANLVDLFLRIEPENLSSTFPCYVSSQTKKESFAQTIQSKDFYNLIRQLKKYNDVIQEPTNNELFVEPHPALKECNSIFTHADKIAQTHQAAYRGKVWLFFIISLAGYAAYELVGNYLGRPLGIGLNAVILVAIFSCWLMIRSARVKQWKWKYQISRGVAEVFRIRGYLNLAGIEPDNQPLILRRHKRRVPLFDHALVIAEIEWWKYQFEPDYVAVHEHWLKSQRQFLDTRITTKGNMGRNAIFRRPAIVRDFLNTWAKNFFVVAITLGAMLFVIQVTPWKVTQEWASGDVGFFMMASIQYILMAAAATALWNELANYASTVSGYEELIELYDAALDIMETNNLPLLSSTLRALAKEALSEHCEWHYNESQSDIEKRG